MLSYFIKQVLLPPISLFLVLGVSIGLYEKKKVVARRVAALTLSLVLLLSTKPISRQLALTVERVPPISITEALSFKPDYILILGGGVTFNTPEFNGGSTPGAQTLERLNYGLHLFKHTEKPILVSGGFGETPEQSEAATMARALRAWGVSDILTETESRNTKENAEFSSRLLLKKGKARVILVTSAAHMPRAAYAFEKTDLTILPAPTGFYSEGPWDKGPISWLPTYRYLDRSCTYIQALSGELWYRLRG